MSNEATQFLAERLRIWQSSPTTFVEEVFTIRLQDWQKQFLQDIASHDQVAVRSAKGVGKTTAIALIAYWWVTVWPESKLAATSPSSGQLEDALWAELRSLLSKRRPPYNELLPYELQSDKLILGNNFARYRTARKDKPESLQGLHSPRMMFLIDEASAVDDEVFAAVQGARTTSGSKIVMTSNPTKDSGYFFNAFHKSRARWKTHHITATDSPYITQAYIDEVRTDWGIHSPQYEIGVLGNFPTFSKNAIIPHHVIEQAIIRKHDPTHDMIWGVDVAWEGADLSCLITRDRFTLYDIHTWSGMDPMETAGIIMSHYHQAARKPIRIYVDKIGMGGGVYARLKELLPPRTVVPVDVRLKQGFDVKKYFQMDVYLTFKTKEWLETASIPQDEYLIEELSRMEYTFRSDGSLTLKDKRETVGRSPDRLDALNTTMLHHWADSSIVQQSYTHMSTSYGSDMGAYR